MKLIICRGLPGSGKSTWAREIVAKNDHFVRVNRDDLRQLLHNGVWDQDREFITVKARDALIGAAFKAGKSAICDDTNLAPKVQRDLAKLAARNGATIEFKDFFDVSLKECIARDALRTGSARVGEDVIKRMFNQHVKGRPQPTVEDVWPKETEFQSSIGASEKYSQQTDLPPCIIVDMDGTLALKHAGRTFWQDDRSHLDHRHEYVIDIVLSYLSAHPDVRLIIMSGRDEGRSYEATINWLNQHSIPYDDVFMRRAGDQRHDSIVKRELYEEHVAPFYTVKFCVDDRNQVVNLWRNDLGLNCIQVADGNF